MLLKAVQVAALHLIWLTVQLARRPVSKQVGPAALLDHVDNGAMGWAA
jgi:hypothetical protein